PCRGPLHPVRHQLSGARSHRDPAVHRRDGQIRADLPPHLAGGWDGRSPPVPMEVITVIGGSTALFAGTIGCVQNDIKRIIAYSTCSQLGYMFLAAGVGAYPVAMFHLINHAFFKALLFMAPG